MDITDTHAGFEKSDKYFRELKESYINKLMGKKEVINESKKPQSGFAVQKQLQKKTKSFSEDAVPTEPEVKPEENDAPTPIDVNAADAVVPPTDTASPEGQEVAPAPVEGGEVAPISTEAPPTDAVSGKELQADPEKVLKTQQFAQATIANSFGDVAQFAPETDILPSGIFKKDIQDPQNGNFTILVYPTEFKAADVVATAFPEPSGASLEAGATDAANPAGAEVVPGAEPVPGAAPTETPVPTDVPPVEGEPVPGAEPEEEKTDEVKLEEARDPTFVGKKDWKKMLQKLLNESKKVVIKEEEKKPVSNEDRLKNLQEKLKNATGEEKEAIEDAIEGLKSRMAKAKTQEVVKKDQESHKVSAEDKEKVEKTEEA